MFEFHIPVAPVPASRPRVTRWGTYYGKKYTAFKKACELLVLTVPPELPTERYVVLRMDINVAPPKKTQLAYPKPDIDNYAKAVMDAITKTGVIWLDDFQVVELDVRKWWANNETEAGIDCEIELL